jgi:hypothetical protein
MRNLTQLPRQEYKGKIFVKKFRRKKLIESETRSGSGAKQPNTFTRQEYKGKIHVKNIIKKLYWIQNRIRIRTQNWIRKYHSGSTTLLPFPPGSQKE